MSSLVSVTKEDWTFEKINTQEFTHGFHQYPARMHPEIAKRLISKYTKKSSDLVFDPFMGSGTVLVESMLHGNNSIGIDLNPFAVLLSSVKTTPINAKKLESTFDKIITDSKKDKKNKITYDNAPNFRSNKSKEETLRFWYLPTTINDLQILKNYVFQIKDKQIGNFFKICFSLTTRKVSFQKNSIYKIYRRTPDQRYPQSKLGETYYKKNRKINHVSFDGDAFSEFFQICEKNIKKMKNLTEKIRTKYAIAKPILGNTFDAPKILGTKKSTLVVTSPPYGDHGTTVAYGQFSKHPGMWLELEDEEELFAVDKNGLGGKKKETVTNLNSNTLDKILKKIKKKDKEIPKTKIQNRAGDVYSFFNDLDTCFDKISKVLKPNQSHCCFVVANRTVRREKIPTDVICVELAKKYGFKHVDTIYRSITNKAMAEKNAPENIVDYTGHTMTKESIIIWEY